ncbi:MULTISPECIES: nucleotide exchange factor GrpE [unclassified Caulobacter]|uniref:nucleotide exchange factor GrpE n=1 Tax=unclassified Caulobacter TaxID=2648921 RepID=UPI000D366885|nr:MULTISPECIES: nucleotide exchange factor GrpE [unclassified Caulobacter]PTS90690.1 nucleotide exchange factor GrpE [Caulobacter sp. HMWF009]PTT13086.1 nucleotide exchange factor GrpE [Caulobacter sp. HMWF025]
MSDEQAPVEEIMIQDGEDAAQEIEALKLEVAALKDQALRYAADVENTKRRAEREMNDARAYAIQKFARDLLGAADNLARATAMSPRDSQDPAVTNYIIGVEMTEKELLAAFERNGLKKIEPAKGEKFDPHLHQAVMEQPSTEVAAGGVIALLQAGYELMGRLVRPAMVAVAAKGSTAPGAAEPPTAAANPYGAAPSDSGGSIDIKS